MMPAWFNRLSRRRTAGLAMLSLVSLGAAGCDGNAESFSGPIDHVIVQVLPINAATTNLARGITLQLRAVPVNGDDNWVDTPVTWSSSDDSRATVDADGKVTTVGGGDVTITAATGGLEGTFDLNIQYPVGTIALDPPTATIRQEGAVTLTAAVLGTDGEPALGRTVTWSSTNPTVATVSSSGVVAGLTDGTTTIKATSEGVEGSATITVAGSPVIATVTVAPGTPFLGVGQVVQFSYTPKAGSGTVINGTTANWSTSAAGVATVDANGLVTVVGPGQATISATVDNGLGVNVVGSSTLTSAPQLVKGVASIVPTVQPGKVYLFAYVVPAGATSFTVSSVGGTGDADLYVFAPGVIPGALDETGNALAFPNSTAFSAAGGNTESITRSSNLPGVWRIYVNAWAGDAAVTGLSVTATHTP